jgi:ubiquinone/menaquinone biosynthesis C-methylase UbiE
MGTTPVTSAVVFDKDNVRDFFEDMAPSYFAKYGSASTEGHSFRSRKAKTLRVIDAYSWQGCSVLDIGCGPGIMVAELLARGFAQVHAIDISQGMVDECRQRFRDEPRVTANVGDATNLAYPEHHFDLVLAMGLLEYFAPDDVDRIYREMTRVLRPKGNLLVTYPNRDSVYRRLNIRPVFSRLKRLAEQVNGNRQRRVAKQTFLADELAGEAKRYGLTVKDIRYYNFKILPYPFDQLLPGVSVRVSQHLEMRGNGPERYLGTGFIALFEKS